MHAETYRVPPETTQAVAATRRAGGRVVAVGTTTVRALESAAVGWVDGLPQPGTSRTTLLIAPGHRWRVVDALLTCFHLPRSTLLALTASFAGRERVLAAYREALAAGYRFDSYGDAMFVA
jgi:S-adenosylmethionine:tRNA ribosyltransferase-isomerase